ncbi:Cullin-3 [Arthroderma uncinatum]|uniref:Cullin-3 n=1 Tax=Arthroderma uncinatum TaxID=74035 RepID=UPI00144A760B|nr:Cullin-3 [Arthroderma uncinatum]KAF3484403.1 Cullin-3 [Arthroderma uncinatum]
MTGRNENDDFNSIWNILAASIREIHTKNSSLLSFEELYRSAYKLVLRKQAMDLYGKVADLEKDWLYNEVRKQVASLITPALLTIGDSADSNDHANERKAAGERLLAKLKEVWEDHQLCMGMITDVLMYMDRVVIQELRHQSIYDTSMYFFRDCVLRSDVGGDEATTISSVFENTILFMIRLEREGVIIDRALIRHCVYMLEGLYEDGTDDAAGKLYHTTFEPAFLEASRRYYTAEGQRLLTTTDAATFCKRVTDRIRAEQSWCQQTLSPVTEAKIMAVIDDCLIKDYIGEVIRMDDSGVKYMTQNDRLDDLRNVYLLNARIDAKKAALTNVVQKTVVEYGTAINTAAKEFSQNPQASITPEAGKKPAASEDKQPTMNLQTAAAIKWVDDVLQLKKKFDRIWEEAFVKDQTMQTSLTTSFSEFININPRSTEYLSLFFDENLRKGIKGKTEEEVDTLIDNGITLLRYIRDKDLFETYYKKHLSRRLLMKRSVSMDAERQMIAKMKMEVGNTFTQRLESMFKDMAVSSDLTSSYRDYIAQHGDPDPKRAELEMSVLTSTMWPMEIMSSYNKDGHVQPPCVYPKNIESLKQSFERFYLDKHSGRKLSWLSGMGTADIRATFTRPNGKVERHDLNVSTYAMVILLLFNDLPTGESLTFEEIQEQTKIPANDLIRNLQSLAVAPKTRVLRKEPMSKGVLPTDKFSFNEQFTSKFTRLKIGVVSSGGNKVENKDERTETEKKTSEERGGTIEAAIVRIMKQRKQLAHSQLITEVISQLASRFMPDVNMVKKRIESLIDREYLERITDSDPPAYSYVA